MRTLSEKRAAFRKLHESGCFVLPNPWDIGTARMFQYLGFSAIASTSAGFAWSMGRPDYALNRVDVLEHLRTLSSSVDLPVNADFESGFASDPEGLAWSVRLAVEAGVSGLSVEDRDLEGKPYQLYGVDRAVERVRASRSAIDRTGQDVILVARTEALLVDPATISPAIDKLVAFADAGADCLYAPSVREKGEIASIVRAVAPKPVNVVMMRPGLSLTELADLGVRRVSIGGALARVAWASTLSLMEASRADRSMGSLAVPAAMSSMTSSRVSLRRFHKRRRIKSITIGNLRFSARLRRIHSASRYGSLPWKRDWARLPLVGLFCCRRQPL